jgi:carbamoyl-phosphate synthase large subunit
MRSILFTSVGNLAFPTVAECLKKSFPESKITGCDVRSNAHGLYFCDKRYLVTWRTNKYFLNQIWHIIRKENIDLLWPLSTEDQPYYAIRKEMFERENVKVVCSDYETVCKVNDKNRFYAALNTKDLRVCVPRFYAVSSYKGIKELSEKLGFPENPFVIKPAIGKGGNGLAIVAQDESQIKSEDFKFKKNWTELKCQLKSYVVPEATLIMEYLGGDEYSVDTLSDNGKFLYGVVRKRYSSTGGLALEAEVVYEPKVLELAKRIIEFLGLSYINNVQFRRDADGVLKVLEINPRIPGSLSLSIKAGADFVSDAMRLTAGEKVTIPKIKFGLRMLRYWSAVYVHKTDVNKVMDLTKKPC